MDKLGPRHSVLYDDKGEEKATIHFSTELVQDLYAIGVDPDQELKHCQRYVFDSYILEKENVDFLEYWKKHIISKLTLIGIA